MKVAFSSLIINMVKSMVKSKVCLILKVESEQG